jgi:hypothetical protein
MRCSKSNSHASPPFSVNSLSFCLLDLDAFCEMFTAVLSVTSIVTGLVDRLRPRAPPVITWRISLPSKKRQAIWHYVFSVAWLATPELKGLLKYASIFKISPCTAECSRSYKSDQESRYCLREFPEQDKLRFMVHTKGRPR